MHWQKQNKAYNWFSRGWVSNQFISAPSGSFWHFGQRGRNVAMALFQRFLDFCARSIEFAINKLSPPKKEITHSKGVSSAATIYLATQVNRWIAENEDGEEDEITERCEMDPNPSAEDINAKARSIDWTDTELRPCIAVGPSSDQKILNVSIKGSLGKPNVDGLLRVHAMVHRRDEVVIVRSLPLDDLNDGIALLSMMLNDEARLWTTVQEWEVYEPRDDDT